MPVTIRNITRFSRLFKYVMEGLYLYFGTFYNVSMNIPYFITMLSLVGGRCGHHERGDWSGGYPDFVATPAPLPAADWGGCTGFCPSSQPLILSQAARLGDHAHTHVQTPSLVLWKRLGVAADRRRRLPGLHNRPNLHPPHSKPPSPNSAISARPNRSPVSSRGSTMSTTLWLGLRAQPGAHITGV